MATLLLFELAIDRSARHDHLRYVRSYTVDGHTVQLQKVALVCLPYVTNPKTSVWTKVLTDAKVYFATRQSKVRHLRDHAKAQ